MFWKCYKYMLRETVKERVGRVLMDQTIEEKAVLSALQVEEGGYVDP